LLILEIMLWISDRLFSHEENVGGREEEVEVGRGVSATNAPKVTRKKYRWRAARAWERCSAADCSSRRAREA
jgi:hypothetical protein